MGHIDLFKNSDTFCPFILDFLFRLGFQSTMIPSVLSAIVFAAILATSLGATMEEHRADDGINCCKGRCKSYRGKMNTTVSGLKCQRWDSNYRHETSYNPKKH